MAFAPTQDSPPTHFAGDDSRHRINFRLWQITMSAIVLVITIWFFTLNSLAGILALVVAKHIWVAILAAGLTRYPKESRTNQNSQSACET